MAFSNTGDGNEKGAKVSRHQYERSFFYNNRLCFTAYPIAISKNLRKFALRATIKI